MRVYDKAHELAAEIKKSDDYREYESLKAAVMADETNKKLIAEYKKLQLEAQAAYISGGEPQSDTMEKLKTLGGLLSFNQDVAAYLAAEYKLQTMVGDVYKIIGDACGIGLDFLTE